MASSRLKKLSRVSLLSVLLISSLSPVTLVLDNGLTNISIEEKVAFAGYKSLSEVPPDKLKVIEYVWDAGIRLGWSKEAVAGALGNMNAESTYDMNLEEATSDPNKGYGLIQWTGSRRVAYEAWLEQNKIDRKNVKLMAEKGVEYIMLEFKASDPFAGYHNNVDSYGLSARHPNGKRAKSVDEWIKSKDVVQAAIDFAADFERPAKWALDQSYAERTEVAQQIFEKYKNRKVNGSSSSSDEEKPTEGDSKDVKSQVETFSEDAIPNMPKSRDYKDSDKNYSKKLEEGAKALNSDEQAHVSEWVSEYQDSKADEVIQAIRIGVMIIAFLSLLAPTLLTTAYAVDLWMVVFDSPMMRLVTFNKVAIDYDRTGKNGLWYVSRKENQHNSIKRVGLGNILMWSAIFSIFGVLALGGILYATVGNIIQFLLDSIGYFGI